MSSASVLVAFCMTFTLYLVSAEVTWMTEYQEDFELYCPDQTFVKNLESIHNNGKEDRVWNIHCQAPLYGAIANMESCSWLEANTVDAKMDFFCPPDQAMAGLGGTYSSPTRDRVYKVWCCDILAGIFKTRRVIHAIEHTGYVNAFDGPLNFTVPDKEVITGIYGYHDNGREDRVFGFVYGKVSQY